MTSSVSKYLNFPCSLLLLASTTSTPAQQSSQQPQQPTADSLDSYTITVTPKLVVLDVVVTDKKGNPVTNLKKEDFEVQEDKKPQHIESFEAPASHAMPPNVVIHSAEELDRLAPNAPATILVLDEYVSEFEYIYTAHQAIQQYLKAQPQLLAQPTMLVAVNVDKMIVLHDFTQDRDAILTALNHHDAGAADYSGSKSRIGQAFLELQVQAGYLSLFHLAQSTANHLGRKNVIWVGRGLPRLEGGSSDQALKLHVDLQKLIDILIASRMTLSTMDLMGVSTKPGTLNPFDDSVVQFAEVAIATGGTPIHNRNDFDVAITNSIRDGSDFYTLSYIPTDGNNAKGAFRVIRIVMKNPNLHATTRTGYYPNPGAEPGWQAATRNLDPSKYLNPRDAIDTVLIGTKNVYNGIPLTLVRTDTPDEVVVRMGSKSLPWIDTSPGQPRAAKIRISCGSFDKQGRMLTQEGTYTEATYPESKPGTPQNEDVEFSINCATDPAAVGLRVVVQATDSGKIGAANLDLETK
jgi:VWFA-related protein